MNTYYKKVALTEDEQIVWVIRQHWLYYLKTFIIGGILLLIPFFFMIALLSQGPIGTAIFAALLLLAVIYCLREGYVWIYNVFVVTNKKIIDIDQKGLFSKTVSEVPFTKIVDVSYHSRGFVQTLSSTGSIVIKTNVPELALMMERVGKVRETCGRLIELIHTGGGVKATMHEVNSEQKMKNADDFLKTPQTETPLDSISLKDLMERYIATYSKQRLKELMLHDLDEEEGEQPGMGNRD